MTDTKMIEVLKSVDAGSVKDWFHCTPDKYTCFEDYQSDSFEDLQCVCGVSQKINAKCKGVLLGRLGSQSMAGEVYILDYKGTKTALKVLPVTSADSDKQNNNEIEKALKASSLKTSGESKHFLSVYGYGLCPDITLKGNFDTKMTEYAIYENVLRSLPHNDRKRATAQYKIMPFDDWVKKYGEYEKEVKKKGHILISELGKADLYTFLSAGIRKDVWMDLIEDSLHAIHDLQTLMGAVHGDLHAKNLLLMKDGSLVIHDFGKSYYPVMWTLKNSTEDIEMLLSDLLSSSLKSTIPVNVLTLLEEMQKYVEKILEKGDKEIEASSRINSIPLLLLEEFFS